MEPSELQYHSQYLSWEIADIVDSVRSRNLRKGGGCSGGLHTYEKGFEVKMKCH